MPRSLALATLAVAALVTPLSFAQKPQPAAVVLQEVPGEIIVCFRTPIGPVDIDRTIANWNLAQADAAFAPAGSQTLMRWQEAGTRSMNNVVLLRVGANANAQALIANLQARRDVVWAEPNMLYVGDPREVVPNDASYGSQYHHPLMQSNLAWDAPSGYGSASVMIAITDDGVDVVHPDLVTNIWVNADEVAGNLIDDDANGFVDDRGGWDFNSGNNNPSPNVGTDTHGTHVAGISAARTNNTIGVAGVAGGCTIMPVQFYGPAGWTAAMVANAFTYATNNGAKIINTSYNIDGWVGNATVTAAFDYLYNNGVLHLNSAGNNGELNPARQAFHQTLLVANTTSTDAASGSSNYGTGIDIAAPGTSILSTLPGNLYNNLSGTSMATPAAAGVAALIWSAHPSWTRDQVAAQLYGTANNIDAQNPTKVGLLGGGRVNSNQAVNATLPAPKISSVTGIPASTSTPSVTGGLKVRFNQIMAPASINAAGAFAMTYAGADGGFGTPDDANIPITVGLYRIGSNEAAITIPSAASLGCGRYRLTANGAILENPFGTNLDGDGNGTPGDSWQQSFKIEPCSGDTNCDTNVNVTDLLAVISAWGTSPGGRSDINGDLMVNVTDLLAVIAAWGPCIPPPPPPPVNDNCVDATPVGAGAIGFNTATATAAGPAVTTCTNTTLKDVWYLFTPASSGTATVNTCAAATFDTYLVAYSGTCAGLTQVTCNDDTTCGGSGLRSQITFPVTAGVPRLIRLGGWNNATGTGTLTISVAP